jgi:D-alanyl-D-alanine endopeptidase (penicillin-binding protein 7)
MGINKLKKYLIFLPVIILITAGLAAFSCLYYPLSASEGITASDLNQYYRININKETIDRGFTVAAFNDALKLSLVPGILQEATDVEIIRLNEILPMPWRLDRISDIYQFEFKNKAAYDDQKPFYIQFSYQATSTAFKQVFFYDKNYGTWRPLPTRDYPPEKFVRSLIHLPFARIAVFAYPDIMASGRASWYAYKNGDYAASPDFPKGSRLRVHNAANGKFVDVVINDYGPDRSRHPDRVIDLDKIAFKKLAPLGAGMIDVLVEPLEVVKENGLVLSITPEGAGTTPKITASSAAIMVEDSSRFIWEKSATATLPLASLTKLVAIKVFLDTKPDLNRATAYSLQDEKLNYEYCQPWESAKLSLKEGETLTSENLVYASLVGSTNNTVETLVRLSGLGREEFIARMNKAAVAWGASSTRFIEPTGLAPANVSSARDYAIITKEVYNHPIIVKASVAPEYSFTTINTKRQFRIKNTNNLLRLNKYAINGTKTGYLDEAGYCLMTRVKTPSGRNLIIASFGAPSRISSFAEMEELILYGLRKLEGKID